MKIIAITGGIAAGKTVVSGRLRELGAEVIDADIISREVTAAGGRGAEMIAEAFGKEFLLPDGEINRRKLREAVFSDPQKLSALNAITHPLIRENISEKIAALNCKYVFVVIPLLFETEVSFRGSSRADSPLGLLGSAARQTLREARAAAAISKNSFIIYDYIWTISADKETRIKRLIARDNISAEQARAILANQVSDEIRERNADVIFYNNGNIKSLKARVDEEYSKLGGW